MKRDLVRIAALCVPLGIAAWLCFTPRAVPRTSGRLPHEVYVWQRSWGAKVPEALDRTAPHAAGFCVLAAEVSWRRGRARVVRVRPDYAALARTGRPVGFALRIGPWSGPFDADGPAAKTLAQLAVAVVRDARSAGVEPAELQIDFDCAESRLDGYRNWVAAIRDAVRPTPVTLTALPCWLDRHAFEPLARAADGYVLQVHSLDPPDSPAAPVVLCDPARAVGWVEEAARIGVPFRVALPTYGYLVAFDRAGRCIGLAAEGPRRTWDAGTRLRVARSDPLAMHALVEAWERDRPAALERIVWYRLPVAGDRLNWSGATLNAILAGRTPRRAVGVEANSSEEELVELTLVNEGELGSAPPARIVVAWQGASLVAADGLRGYAAERGGPQTLCLRAGAGGFQRLAPGERWAVGWLRFDAKPEVKTDVCLSKE
jgi:hypothetical protein